MERKIMSIDEAIKRLQHLHDKYGNLPFYLMYDDFVYIQIDRIEIVEESKSYHVTPRIYPKRAVCMGGVDSQMYVG